MCALVPLVVGYPLIPSAVCSKRRGLFGQCRPTLMMSGHRDGEDASFVVLVLPEMGRLQSFCRVDYFSHHGRLLEPLAREPIGFLA